MKRSFYINVPKTLCALVCFSLLCGMIGSMLCLGAGAAFLKQYTVTLDHPTGVTATNMPIVLKNVVQGTDPELTLAGWIKTDQTIKLYEYTLDGGKTWKRSSKAVQSRPDVKAYCPKTYQTAGFHLNIDLSELPRGTYDIFLRAYTSNDDIIEVLAMLDISIGQTDTETVMYRELNLSALGAQDGVLSLQARKDHALDAYNLRDYQRLEIITDQSTVFTLKSDASSAISFSATSQEPVQNEDGTYTCTIDLKNAQYAGKLLLASTQQVNISRIRFYTSVPDYYKGELGVHFTATPNDYFSGSNGVETLIMSDDTVGTFTRLYPPQDTNDPYIYYNLDKYVKDTLGTQISADHYRYAVITLQTPPTNSQGHFRLFLCAGDIRGPHGESHVSFVPTNDGQWHKYVIPLCDEEHWVGTIYGMRFDFIDASVKSSDYANIASISLHPDEKSAKQAAAQPFEQYYEQGKAPEDQFKEEGRAPSGKADAITYFDASMSDCFEGANKAKYSFDEYGHLILQATETTNDPFVSFNMQTYASLTGQPLLRTEDYGIIVLRVFADKKIEGNNFVLYYYADGYDFAQGTRAIGAFFEGGDWEYLIYDMSEAESWKQDILGFRLDFASQISATQTVCLADMLFFKDIKAWEAYAKQNGIAAGDESLTDDPANQAPETEIPTIEIPTQGPGLEFVPPEQSEQNDAGCHAITSISAILLVSLSAVSLIKNKTKKGDQS